METRRRRSTNSQVQSQRSHIGSAEHNYKISNVRARSEEYIRNGASIVLNSGLKGMRSLRNRKPVSCLYGTIIEKCIHLQLFMHYTILRFFLLQGYIHIALSIIGISTYFL